MSGGNLMQRINSKTRLPENECKMIFYQLTLGVKYLHEEGIVHRDLKVSFKIILLKLLNNYYYLFVQQLKLIKKEEVPNNCNKCLI